MLGSSVDRENCECVFYTCTYVSVLVFVLVCLRVPALKHILFLCMHVCVHACVQYVLFVCCCKGGQGISKSTDLK